MSLNLRERCGYVNQGFNKKNISSKKGWSSLHDQMFRRSAVNSTNNSPPIRNSALGAIPQRLASFRLTHGLPRLKCRGSCHPISRKSRYFRSMQLNSACTRESVYTGYMVKKMLKAALRWPKLTTVLTAGAVWVGGYFGLDLPAEELSGAIGGAVALVAALAFTKKQLPAKSEEE